MTDIQFQYKDLIPPDLKILDDTQGIVGAFVAVIGNKDSVGDIIQPGAFDTHLKTRMPKGVWSHDWDRPVSKTLKIEEIKAGDARLPASLQAGGYGALYVETQFNLKTDEGRNAYENVKFYEGESEWSIGYRTHDEEFDRKQGANLLKEVELYEYSPVLFGANAMTSTAFIKAEKVNGQTKIEVRGVDVTKLDAIKSAVARIIEEPTEGETMVPDKDDTTTEDQIKVIGDGTVTPDEIKDALDGDITPAGDEKDASDAAENKDAPVEGDAPVVGEKEENLDNEAPAGDDVDKEKVATPDVAGGGEKGSPRANRVKIIEEKDEGYDLEVKALAGSFEERYANLSKALGEEFKDVGYTYVFATFESKVVYFLYDRKTEDQGYWEADYAIDGKDIKIGDSVAVEVVEVLVLKRALEEAIKYGMDSQIEKTITDVMAEKAGRVLSKNNESLLKTAIESIQAVLGTSDDNDEEKTVVVEPEVKADGEIETPAPTSTPVKAKSEGDVAEDAGDTDVANADEDVIAEVKTISDADFLKSLAEYSTLFAK